MNLSSKLRVSLCSLLPGMLLFGCSSPPDGQDIEITFDGERCEYQGPEAIPKGEVVVLLNNLTDHEFLHLHVGTFREGWGWQDLVDYMDGSTRVRAKPFWMTNIVPTSVDGDSEWLTRTQESYFREWQYSMEPGNYYIICANHRDVSAIWLAAPLEVRANP